MQASRTRGNEIARARSKSGGAWLRRRIITS